MAECHLRSLCQHSTVREYNWWELHCATVGRGNTWNAGIGKNPTFQILHYLEVENLINTIYKINGGHINLHKKVYQEHWYLCTSSILSAVEHLFPPALLERDILSPQNGLSC